MKIDAFIAETLLAIARGVNESNRYNQDDPIFYLVGGGEMGQ